MTGRLAERYEPLEVVGKGGEGRVIRAWDHLHDRPVAVKIRGPGSDRVTVLSEARVLLSLTPHRLLPLVRDDFFSGDEYCLVMDWVDGETLAQRLARTGRPGMALEDVVGALTQVAEVLDHLHDHVPPVIHGDVKPANIVLTPDGRAVLVDFGIARSGGPGPAYASRGYAAPEVATAANPTPAADIFSLAATAFTLLTGTPPGSGVRPRWHTALGERAPQVEMALRRGLAYEPIKRPECETTCKVLDRRDSCATQVRDIRRRQFRWRFRSKRRGRPCPSRGSAAPDSCISSSRLERWKLSAVSAL